MKILYISDPEPDMGSAQLYMGLWQLLGEENVVDFPYKNAYHGKYELLEGVDIVTYMKDNPTRIVAGKNSGYFPWQIPSNSIEYHYNEIVDMIKNDIFNLVLMPVRYVATYYLRRLINDCGSRMPPVIICDFEDSSTFRFDIVAEFDPYIKIMTKSSYHPTFHNEQQSAKQNYEKYIVYPTQMSSPLIDNPVFQLDDKEENKLIDITARMALTRPPRKTVVESLQEMGKYHNKTVIAELTSGCPYPQYIQDIVRSKIAVAMRGHGPIGVSNKTWEIPSYNTLMLLETPNSVYEYPFEDGKTCIHFNAEIKDDVVHKALFWLNNDMENERRKIAKAGNEHLKKYHTCKKRSERLLEIAHIEGLT